MTGGHQGGSLSTAAIVDCGLRLRGLSLPVLIQRSASIRIARFTLCLHLGYKSCFIRSSLLDDGSLFWRCRIASYQQQHR